mmetsp:Transcript_25244/g.57712  ORF Transcript_25244/g.57712 Transcript_25244/m.57712 type:complete len:161 (+) Transcript_25244:126-608(+)
MASVFHSVTMLSEMLCHAHGKVVVKANRPCPIDASECDVLGSLSMQASSHPEPGGPTEATLTRRARTVLFSIFGQEEINQLSERLKFFLWYELELQDEVHEVLEAGVQMRLERERLHPLVVVVEDVGVHPEEALVDVAHLLHEVRRERHARRGGEQPLVV